MRSWTWNLMCALLLALCLALIIIVDDSDAHFVPNSEHNQVHAITYAFCHHSFKPCKNSYDAVKVAKGESSSWWFVTRSNPQGCAAARNGQYLGCFQMGSSERRKYGNSAGVWGQARAAWKYFVDSGSDWSPWECKPWGCGW